MASSEKVLQSMRGGVSCPVQRECGGCPQMVLSEREQRNRKVLSLRGALPTQVRDVPIGWVSTSRLAYRRRIRLRVDSNGRARFFNEAKQNGCVVLSDSLAEAIADCQATRFGGASHVEVRGEDLDGQRGLFVAPVSGASVEVVDPPSRFRVSVGEESSSPSNRAGSTRWQRFAVTDEVWSYVPVTAFLQVHAATNRALVASIQSGACRRELSTFADPFAGAGNFALALAQVGLRGAAGDIDQEASFALRAAATRQGLNIDVTHGAAGRTVEAELLVANPPRAGLKEAAEALVDTRPRHVALVTCTVAAASRDIARLAQLGYRVDEMTAFDMFPHTDHVELLTWLSASD